MCTLAAQPTQGSTACIVYKNRFLYWIKHGNDRRPRCCRGFIHNSEYHVLVDKLTV